MRRSGVAGVLLLAGLVVGCGSDPTDPADPADPSTAAVTTESAGTSGAGSTASPAPPLGEDERSRERRPRRAEPTRDPLADLVEDLAPDLGSRVDEPVLGADLSWPQCPAGMGIPLKRSSGAPPPVDAAQYVVIGLTNGPGFYPNPCLRDQVDDARARGRMVAAYSVASYPEPDRLVRHADDGPFDGGTRLGALANNGYAQAEFNLRTMRAAQMPTPVVWIDVEPVPDFPWSSDLEANSAVVEGLARGYRDAGYRIGVYSTAYLWDVVVGDLSLGIPEWRAAGQTSREAALAMCEPERTIQGGEAVLGQWVEADRDMNVTCPGISLEMERWFHQF